MAPSIEDLDRRVTVLEGRVAMEGDLRAALDRDLSDFRLKQDKMMGSLQALATTVSEHNRKIDGLTTKVEQHGRILDQHTEVLNQHTQVLGRLEGGMQQITGMLTTLIERDERRS